MAHSCFEISSLFYFEYFHWYLLCFIPLHCHLTRKKLNKFFHFSGFCSFQFFLIELLCLYFLNLRPEICSKTFAMVEFWTNVQQATKTIMFFSWTFHYVYVDPFQIIVTKMEILIFIFIFFWLSSIPIHSRFPPYYFLLDLNNLEKIYQKSFFSCL